MDKARLTRRAMIGGMATASSLVVFPMLNTGAYRVHAASPRTYSKRVVDLVRGSIIIDMLGPLSLDLRPETVANKLTAAQIADFRASGITAFHNSFGVGGPDAYALVLEYLAGWSAYVGHNDDVFTLVRDAADLDRAKRQGISHDDIAGGVGQIGRAIDFGAVAADAKGRALHRDRFTQLDQALPAIGKGDRGCADAIHDVLGIDLHGEDAARRSAIRAGDVGHHLKIFAAVYPIGKAAIQGCRDAGRNAHHHGQIADILIERHGFFLPVQPAAPGADGVGRRVKRRPGVY